MVVVRSFLFLAVLCLFSGSNTSLAQLLSLAPTNSTADVRLGWKPSPSPNATGYFLCWGLSGGQCTNRIDVGSVTNTSLTGLDSDVTYYFTVVAYSDLGDEAPPSNEVSVKLEPPPPPPTMAMSLSGAPGQSQDVNLSFSAVTGRTYEIQATGDFQSWTTIWTTNATASGLLTFSEPRQTGSMARFYRVKETTR